MEDASPFWLAKSLKRQSSHHRPHRNEQTWHSRLTSFPIHPYSLLQVHLLGEKESDHNHGSCFISAVSSLFPFKKRRKKRKFDSIGANRTVWKTTSWVVAQDPSDIYTHTILISHFIWKTQRDVSIFDRLDKDDKENALRWHTITLPPGDLKGKTVALLNLMISSSPFL